MRLRPVSALLVSLATLAFLSSCAGAAEQRRTRELAIDSSMDISALADGDYEGRYSYSGLEYRATVRIADGHIADIAVIANKEAPRESWARPLIDEVKSRNSLDVDVVAGATTSSKAILMSIEDALEKAPAR